MKMSYNDLLYQLNTINDFLVWGRVSKDIVSMCTASQIIETMKLPRFCIVYSTFGSDCVPTFYELSKRIDRDSLLDELLSLGFDINELNCSYLRGLKHVPICEDWKYAMNILNKKLSNKKLSN